MEENNQIETNNQVEEIKQTKKKRDFVDTFLNITLILCFFIGLLFIVPSFFPYESEYIYNYLKGIKEEEIKIKNKNEYYLEDDFNFVQNTNNFYPKNYEELLNILHTFINSGEKEFSFYCQKDYKDCTKDAKKLIKNEKTKVTDEIYQFNHPYNDFDKIYLSTVESTGKITFRVDKKYTEEQIKAANRKADELFKILYKENDTIENNIKRIHDYLIENTEYDKDKRAFIKEESKDDSIYASDTAYGTLLEGKAICSGYTDAMFLFLERMNLKQYRVSGVRHIWNAVEIDGVWYHLDLTWDDARYTNGKTFTSYKYFLVDSETLLKNDSKTHTFKPGIWTEFDAQ